MTLPFAQGLSLAVVVGVACGACGCGHDGTGGA